ncbi:MAG: DUF559 domain-containing protein [Ahrensia sp.]|nr:DUF559 domain-containing protein [Ahrensia sp.]
MAATQQSAKHFARTLRKKDNEAEAKLWTHLRDRRLHRFKFVREFSIGPYFADFACRQKKLVVESDGSQHVGSEHDAVRDTYLNENGWSVLRFQAGDILKDISWVLTVIVEVLEGRIHSKEEAGPWRFWPATRNKF